ncbi:hypothetical protein SUGI_0350270 [Cryptomeria japonica]|nr:hypothetical protein SUGI_0350270 [Cryptomeria japonica]
MTRSRILIIGGTGYIGRHVVKASIAQDHPTYLLVRDSRASNPAKDKLLESFTASGAHIVHGSLDDHTILVEAIKKVNVVISTVGGPPIMDQLKIIKAIKEAGNIRLNLLRPCLLTRPKSVGRLRQKAFSTHVSSNCFAGYFVPNLGQPGLSAPPRHKTAIFGDGNAKAVFVKEEDIGTFTIKAVDDPRLVNKTLYLRIPANTLSLNELVALWEMKIGKTLEKVCVPEEAVLKQIEETPFPANLRIAISHSIFVKGDETNFEIGPEGVEGSQIFPDVIYTTVDELLNQYFWYLHGTRLE